MIEQCNHPLFHFQLSNQQMKSMSASLRAHSEIRYILHLWRDYEKPLENVIIWMPQSYQVFQ